MLPIIENSGKEGGGHCPLVGQNGPKKLADQNPNTFIMGFMSLLDMCQFYDEY